MYHFLNIELYGFVMIWHKCMCKELVQHLFQFCFSQCWFLSIWQDWSTVHVAGLILCMVAISVSLLGQSLSHLHKLEHLDLSGNPIMSLQVDKSYYFYFIILFGRKYCGHVSCKIFYQFSTLDLGVKCLILCTYTLYVICVSVTSSWCNSCSIVVTCICPGSLYLSIG